VLHEGSDITFHNVLMQSHVTRCVVMELNVSWFQLKEEVTVTAFCSVQSFKCWYGKGARGSVVPLVNKAP